MPNPEPPGRILERHLQKAIMASLHELLPEFHAHVVGSKACQKFHEWAVWRHQDGTNEWRTDCPDTGVTLTIPFQFGRNGRKGEKRESS